MERAVKQQVVADLRERMAKAASVVLADFRGLTVEVTTGLRREFRAAQCDYRVVKNTLLGLAIKGTQMEPLGKLLEGPTAVAISREDPAAPAKIAQKFAKDQAEKFVIKGGFVEGKVLDAKGVFELSKLPGRNDLRAQLLGLLETPATDLLRMLSAVQTELLLVLQARIQQLEQQGGSQ